MSRVLITLIYQGRKVYNGNDLNKVSFKAWVDTADIYAPIYIRAINRRSLRSKISGYSDQLNVVVEVNAVMDDVLRIRYTGKKIVNALKFERLEALVKPKHSQALAPAI